MFISVLSKFPISHRYTQSTGTLPTRTCARYSAEALAHRKTTHLCTVHFLINKHTHVNTWKQYANTYKEICKCTHK